MGNQQQGSGGGLSQAAGGGGYSASPSTVLRRPLKQQEPMPLKEEVERRFDELLVGARSDTGSVRTCSCRRSVWILTVAIASTTPSFSCVVWSFFSFCV